MMNIQKPGESAASTIGGMIRRIFAVGAAATLSGCLIVDCDSAFAKVEDSGPFIKTKYRYRVAEVRMPHDFQKRDSGKWLSGGSTTQGDGSRRWASSSSSSDPCCRAVENAKWALPRLQRKTLALQPDVFAEDGIPVTVSKAFCAWHMDMSVLSYPLFLASLTVFPLIQYGSQTNAVSVEIADFDVSSSMVAWGGESKEAVCCLWMPIGGLCANLAWDDPPSKEKDKKEYRAWKCMARTMPGEDTYSVSDSTEVYAIAALLKKLEDSGEIDAARTRIAAQKKAAESRRRAGEERLRLRQAAEASIRNTRDASSEKPPYRLINLVREKGTNFAYTFALELSENASIETFFGVQNAFANEVLASYMMEYPNANSATLRVAVHPQLSEGRIIGRAEVLTIAPVSLVYDAGTRYGKLSVRFNPNQYEEARVWARRNIETLARDKNIALVTGVIPPAARFYSLGESLKDGNILEIEFKTE